MGLESVQLLVEVEDSYGIVISDEKAEKIETVDDFVSVIIECLNQRDKNICKTQHLFYRLRKLLDNYSCENIKLSDYIIDHVRDHDEYKEIERNINLTLPKLEIPSWLSWFSFISVILVLIISFIIIGISYLLAPIAVTLFYIWIKIINLLDRKFRLSILRYSIREFIEITAAINFKNILPEVYSSKEVQLLVRRKISNSFGLEMSDIKGYSRIAKDLGIE